jgi:hypothetical protein
VPAVEVCLAEGTGSGLAHIVLQLLEQDLAEFESKRQQAARLRGRVTMTDSEHDVSVTLDVRGDRIVICDGAERPVDASIAGPHRELVGLLQGRTSALGSHLRGRLRVRSSWRRPFFPLRVHRLMRLASEPTGRHRTWIYAIVAALIVAAGAISILLNS